MATRRRYLSLLAAFLIWGNLNSARASVSPEAYTTSASSLTTASYGTPSPSGVIIDEAGARKNYGSSSSSGQWEKTRVREPPGSPVKLFMPDEFQFYTLNNNGQLVMKQMTKQEIQGMIAAGSAGHGQLPVDLGHHESQLTEAVPKVSDVVQNVQKVLKGELNKPVPIHSSGSSIPGSVNSQWTNMLPYILSGGSVDQQDITQDTSILLPGSDSDQSYIDVVPLQNEKPSEEHYEPETNYVHVQPAFSEKPISLLGNMAIDTGILSEQNTYTASTKSRPNRPMTTSTSHKLTSTKPSSTSVIKENYDKITSSGKPTLYIPSLLDSEHQNNYQTYSPKPNSQQNKTKIPEFGGVSTTSKEASVYDYSNEYTKVPIFSTESFLTSTLRTNQQHSSISENLPTISLSSVTNAPVRDGLYPSKINVGPIGGFKKPETIHKPSGYRPVYEPVNKLSTVIFPPMSSYHPVYEAATKPTINNKVSQTYRPVYDPMSRPNTEKITSTTYQYPVYQPTTKLSTASFEISSSYHPIYEVESKHSTYQPTNEGFKVTKYPLNTFTTRKASSPMLEIVTKPSTLSEMLKVTKYPSTNQVYTTGKSTTMNDFVTKSKTQNNVLAVTRSPAGVNTTVKNQETKSTPSYVIQQTSSLKKKPELSSSSQIAEKDQDASSKISNEQKITNNNIKQDSYQSTVTVLPTSEKTIMSQTISTVTASSKPSMKVKNSTVSNNLISQLLILPPEESSTEYNDYTFVPQEETTIQSEIISKSTEFTPLEKSDVYSSNNHDLLSESTESISIFNQQLETTTQNILIDEATTEYFTLNYSGDETKKINNEASSMVNEESSTNKQETTYVPTKDNDIKTEYGDSTVGYTTIFDKESSFKDPSNEYKTIKPIMNSDSAEYTTIGTAISDTEKSENNSKKPVAEEIQKNDSSSKNSSKEKEEVIVGNDYQSVTEKINKLSTQASSNANENSYSNIKIVPYSQTIRQDEEQNKSNLPLYENKIMELVDSYQSKLSESNHNKSEIKYTSTSEIYTTKKTNEQPVINSLKDQIIPVHEKIELSTEKSVTTKEKIGTNKISQSEDEVSTVKVIPVYDDDASIYSLPLNVPNKSTTTSTTSKSSETNNPESLLTTVKYYETTTPLEYSESTESIKFTEQNNSPSSTISSTSSYTLKNDYTSDTVLPGLQETFNIYMKEHYDPNLSTTGNYDEISYLTTFPPMIYKGASMNKNKLTTEPSELAELKSDDLFIDKVNQQKTDEELTTTASSNSKDTELPYTELPTTENILENLDNFESEQKLDFTTENSFVNEMESLTTKIPELKETISPEKQFQTNDKNNLETPIIYLDLTSPDPNEHSASHQSVKDNISNSSLTRIKIKNPVLEVDKIISEAPAETVTSATVAYTLPSDPIPPNNIASGLIAGYPTYNQGKPISEYITNTSSIINTTGMSIDNKDKLFVQEKIDENTEKPLISPLQNNLKDGDQVTTKNVNIIQSEETTYDYQTSEFSNYESYTQLPSETIHIASKPEISSQNEKNDQANNSFNPPLEKISDLINQLQNSPSQHDPIGFDYSNGVATTIVPLERFGTIMNESNSSTNDQVLTTLFDSISKISAESKNDTYVVLQTTKPYESSTQPIVESTTTENYNKIETTTQINTKNKSSSSATTVLAIVKQTVTGKPYVTTTYGTTRGSLEKIQSTIDKSAGRINLEDEKTKMPFIRPTEPSKFTMKNKGHYSSARIRPTNEGYQSYTRKTTKPVTKAPTFATTEPTTVLKSTENIKELNSTEKWSLPSQKIVPELNAEVKNIPASAKEEVQQPNPQIVTLDHSSNAVGLDQSNKGLDKDVAGFTNVCNELSFKFWTLANAGLSTSRSITISPFGMISTLAMIYLGARGHTSILMNDVLKLDDVSSFNPHLFFQNITDRVTLARGEGIENAAFVRALFADRLKVRKIITFYKDQAQQFYEGAVVDINFLKAGDILRRRTNLLIRKQTGGRIKDFLKSQTVALRSPLTALSANVFQTSCDGPDASVEGRDGEMYFAVSQTVKQRKLMPIPAVVWKSGVAAGYEPSLDATAVAIGEPSRPVYFIMIMPGQQGLTAPGDNLDRLENRLFGNPVDNPLDKLLKVIIPRRVEVQMPRFGHRSVVNFTTVLKKMGFDQLFTRDAVLLGINGAGHDLYLADMLQMNLFCTCGENKLSETYPGTPSRNTRAWKTIKNSNSKNYEHLENNEPENFEASESIKCDEEEDDWTSSDSTLESNKDEVSNQQRIQSGEEDSDKISDSRQASNERLRRYMPTKRRRCRNRRQAEPEKPRMKMDKPFLYLIRHNPTGLILHMGRFNPKNQS